MLTIIYICGSCFVLCVVVVRYEYFIVQFGGQRGLPPRWMFDLLASVVVTLWPLLLPGFIRGCYREFVKVQKDSRRKR